jgi:hypothetical protein
MNPAFHFPLGRYGKNQGRSVLSLELNASRSENCTLTPFSLFRGGLMEAAFHSPEGLARPPQAQYLGIAKVGRHSSYTPMVQSKCEQEVIRIGEITTPVISARIPGLAQVSTRSHRYLAPSALRKATSLYSEQGKADGWRSLEC